MQCFVSELNPTERTLLLIFQRTNQVQQQHEMMYQTDDQQQIQPQQVEDYHHHHQEKKILTPEQIETYMRDGVLVVDNVLSGNELSSARTSLQETLWKYGVDINNLQETGHHFTKLSSTNGSGGVLDIYYETWQIQMFAANPRLFQITTELWDAMYGHPEEETRQELAGTNTKNHFMWHPYGNFDCQKGYMYIDRLGYRLPTQLALDLGMKMLEPNKTTKFDGKPPKVLPIQRSLTPHLDCCPSDLFATSQKKWRPVQCFVSLTDDTEPSRGGFEAVKGFHREFHSWAAHRQPTSIITRSSSQKEVTFIPAPCVGEYTHIRPKEDCDVMKRIQHIPVSAGSAVFWDIR
jgi:hypothetical protein